ncbi:tyrosine-protein phosphatase [Novosphingobium sp.]|uniref:tyrosine-protein phosphatase n=1 Tax=Novosphingobium sp. TaxID=1874826 RepID=UPI00262836C9|nr:tyrosine-protein phosphatase [Novosphingobium sp.]
MKTGALLGHGMVPLAIMALLSAQPVAAKVTGAEVIRAADGTLTVRWQATGPVDVLVASDPQASVKEAQVVSAADLDGSFIDKEGSTEARRFFTIRDRQDGSAVHVAERVLPLEQGSNFRDIGGYPAAGGKTIRWGTIYRSGATPLLTVQDQARIRALGLRNMIDLRSDEERVLAPSRIDGVAYSAIGYQMGSMMNTGAAMRNGAALYHNFPKFFAPQLKVIFDKLKRNEGPLAFNCSAGQDRTGFASAMVMSALGVPRDVIVRDYLLSTEYRRPQFELPRINPELYKDNPVALMFARYQGAPGADKPQPLLEADGTPYLAGAFAEIETKWGSVDNYLRDEIGLTAQDIAALRRSYLE